MATVNQAISRVEKSGIQQPAPTVTGRLEQARRWLEQPGADDRDLGRQAINLVVEDGNKIASVLPGLFTIFSCLFLIYSAVCLQYSTVCLQNSTVCFQYSAVCLQNSAVYFPSAAVCL